MVGVRSDGRKRSTFLKLADKIKLYEELKVLIEDVPNSPGYVRYRNGMVEEDALKFIQEKIPNLTEKNLESVRKEIFGKMLPKGRTKVIQPGEERMDDLEQQLELVLLEIEALKRAHAALLKELHLDAQNLHFKGDVRRA